MAFWRSSVESVCSCDSFGLIVNTGVSLALLFDPNKSDIDKAWELAGLIPIPGVKNAKYAGEVTSLVMKQGDSIVKVARSAYAQVLHITHNGRWAEYVGNTLKRIRSLDVDANEAALLSKVLDPDQLADIVRTTGLDPSDIYKITTDRTGRRVFLSKGSIGEGGHGAEHILREVRDGNMTRFEQLRKDGIIPDGEDLDDLIEKVVKEGGRSNNSHPGTILYELSLSNGEKIQMSTNELTGKIITIF